MCQNASWRIHFKKEEDYKYKEDEYGDEKDNKINYDDFEKNFPGGHAPGPP